LFHAVAAQFESLRSDRASLTSYAAWDFHPKNAETIAISEFHIN
jgi:hypothetical protein